VFVQLCYWNCSDDGGPQIFSLRAACWSAVLFWLRGGPGLLEESVLGVSARVLTWPV
jgi:hypothetical protein